MKKHVIILGAGASKSSGYPLANELTLLMCDRETFAERVRSILREEVHNFEQSKFYETSILSYFDKFRDATLQLRHGDFATMDELSRFAIGGDHSDVILKLKKLMRFVFALNHADLNYYAQSDYRRLIQKLLPEGRIRNDVSILSFNYDPYLEFRMLRAFNRRQEVRPFEQENLDSIRQAINSGFLKPSDQSWTEWNGFCHLKLHGTCVIPSKSGKYEQPAPRGDCTTVNSYHLFYPATPDRLLLLSDTIFEGNEPPILLPWEIIHEDGRVLNHNEFGAIVGDQWQHKGIFPLFESIWRKAKAAVMAAERISFVGLSMNSYLEPAFKYLLSDKTGDLEVSVANPLNEKFKNAQRKLHPLTPCGAVYKTLKNCAGSGLMIYGTEAERIRTQVQTPPDALIHKPFTPEESITAYSSFSDFIESEL